MRMMLPWQRVPCPVFVSARVLSFSPPPSPAVDRPIACGVDAGPLLNYTGGVISDPGQGVDHIVSVIGWGVDPESGKSYWQMRNSWGEFWGEMGYAKVEKGKNALKLEGGCNWAVPDKWTDMESGGNFPCDEGGANCNQHLPPPPPLNCEKYCTKSSIAMCSQLGMHCVCESRAHALCGIDCWHAYLTCDRLVSQVGTSNTTRLEKACPTAPAAAVTQAAAANATPRRWCRTTCFTSLAPGRDSESGQRGGCDVSPMQHGAVGQNVSSIEPPAMAKSSRRATPRTGLYY